ncbi:hypothetical protein LshimejAT787_0410960 [Lyophyllum shimeji]|uniref:Uncharacterized protein n=1 Tax=Lyophyllum shimeji TaxID=47721 RepID=A0A9P3PLC6_LYOSH|nr:hypothetical protein LshimejAT787_0410960 [Lyophyllum shimeji]
MTSATAGTPMGGAAPRWWMAARSVVKAVAATEGFMTQEPATANWTATFRKAGLPRKSNESFTDTFAKADALFQKAAMDAGRTTLYMQQKYREHYGQPSLTIQWNRYQAYFTANRAEERKRAGKQTVNIPDYIDLLNIHEEHDIMEEQDAMCMRDRRTQFRRTFAKMQQLARRAGAMNIGMSDSHGWKFCLQEFFPKRLAVSNEEVIGFAKTEAYDAIAKAATLEVIANRKHAQTAMPMADSPMPQLTTIPAPPTSSSKAPLARPEFPWTKIV